MTGGRPDAWNPAQIAWHVATTNHFLAGATAGSVSDVLREPQQQRARMRRNVEWFATTSHVNPASNRHMNKLHFRLSFAWLVAIGSVAVPAGPQARQNAPSLRTESTVVRSYDGRSIPAETLRLTVPARRGRTGSAITIAALRVRTTATQPGNPIVFLMGGPGIPGTVMAPIPPYFTLFERLRALGDVIIVDQRGIGGSEPGLDCPFDAALPVDVFVNTRGLVGTIQQQVAACAAQWRAKDAEPKNFNTLESADDIDDLRRALGAETIDLLAFSYGTRLALAVVQRHGDHVGRVVLQGVNGPGLVVKRPGPVTRKLQRIGALLKQDASWQGPTDLLAVSQKARMRLVGAPAAVTINDQRAAQPITLQVSRQGFDAIVSLNLDDARLPALLISVAEGDDRVLTRFVEAAWNGLGSGKVGLMARAVNCAADRPAARWALVATEAAAAPFGEAIDNAFLTEDFCRAVGYDTAAVEFAKPVQSAAPVLMLTGALDATNPIENAGEVARGFSNATVLEIENAAHEALTVPAVQDAVVDFLRGKAVGDRRLAAAVPHFASVAEALAPRTSQDLHHAPGRAATSRAHLSVSPERSPAWRALFAHHSHPARKPPKTPNPSLPLSR